MPENDEGTKWEKKEDERRFICARNGDMVCAPFQCDFCSFINLQGREADPLSLNDDRLLGYIRRANLDMFWSREESTVYGVWLNLRKGVKMSKSLGLEPIYLPQGPWPVRDEQGLQIAIEMIRATQERGRNADEYVQFDTVRKMRAAYTNAMGTVPDACRRESTFRGDGGKSFFVSSLSTDSKFFRMFLRGMEKRMGRLVIQNTAISMEILLKMLELYEIELKDRQISHDRKRAIVICASAFVILFAGALRGGEVFLLEATELISRIDDGRNHPTHPHVCVPLMGRFKGENGERNLLLALASTTASNLEVRKWMERLVTLLIYEGKEKMGPGPAICEPNGFQLPRWKLNGELHFILEKVREVWPTTIDKKINIEDSYNIHRSFRRGATTQAQEMGVDNSTIDTNNRWRKVQNKSGGMPYLPMSQLYMDIQQALKTRLRFSRAL